MDRRGFLASAGVAAAAVALPHDVRASEPSCDPVPVTRYGADMTSIYRVLAESCDVLWPKVTSYPYCHVITQTLPLRSYQTWWFEDGAVMRWYGPAGVYTWMVDTSNSRGARITGNGRIDGRRTDKTGGLHIGPNTTDLLVEDVAIDRFGTLAGDWGVLGDGIYMTGGGPIGSADEAANPHGLTFRNITVSRCARNAVSWLRGWDATWESCVFEDTGGTLGPTSNKPGESNAPGACVCIEPSKAGTTGPPFYRIDGIMRDCTYRRSLVGVGVFSRDWHGPVRLVHGTWEGNSWDLWPQGGSQKIPVEACA